MDNEKNPIQNILISTFGNLKNFVDVNSVIGTPISLADGTTIIPVSKVSVGLVSGGGQYDAKNTESKNDYPFSGGSGSGFCICPMGFVSVRAGDVKMINVDGKSSFDKLLQIVPNIISAIGDAKNDKSKK